MSDADGQRGAGRLMDRHDATIDALAERILVAWAQNGHVMGLAPHREACLALDLAEAFVAEALHRRVKAEPEP